MSQTTSQAVRWTTADIESLAADEWKRYEIIDGELFVGRAPHLGHQDASGNIYAELRAWSRRTGLGKAVQTPGIIFSDADNVIPDLIWVSQERLWVSQERLEKLLDEDGHLTGAPELIVEVLSLGSSNERRDREAKLKLYSVQGVQEYWLCDWRQQELVIYRRESAQLKQVAILLSEDEICSPLLPGFSCQVRALFE